jgi:hypothetical protein
MRRKDSLGAMNSRGQMDCDDAPAGEGCGSGHAVCARLGSAHEPEAVHQNDADDDDMDEIMSLLLSGHCPRHNAADDGDADHELPAVRAPPLIEARQALGAHDSLYGMLLLRLLVVILYNI